MKLLCAALVCSALPMMAAQPFTGTWKVDVSSAKWSGKPTEVELANGTYKCLSCTTPYTVKADGKDQAVTGQPGFDTMSARIIDDNSVEFIQKKAGKIVSQSKYTVSADGATFTSEATAYPASSDKPITATVTANRVGKSVAGMHAYSGSWMTDKVQESDNGLLVSYEQTADGLKMTEPSGAHFDAKLDGQEYPVLGVPSADAKVILEQIDANTIEMTNKNRGKIMSTARYTVSPDGRSMTVEGQTSTGVVQKFVRLKQ